VAYEGGRTDGRVQAMPLQSDVTACFTKHLHGGDWFLQVKLVMSLLSDDVLSRGQEVTRDILKQMKYIPSESTEQR